jgi:hypothetical protein
VTPRDVGAGIPSHTGYPLTVRYGENEPVEVDGRVKAIILALMRDAHEMGLERVRQGGITFQWGSGRLRWKRQQKARRRR